MAAIPKKTEARIRAGIKKYKGVVRNAKDRDVNESDTVTIITDILSHRDKLKCKTFSTGSWVCCERRY
jgi:hypothetical protein